MGGADSALLQKGETMNSDISDYIHSLQGQFVVQRKLTDGTLVTGFVPEEELALMEFIGEQNAWHVFLTRTARRRNFIIRAIAHLLGEVISHSGVKAPLGKR